MRTDERKKSLLIRTDFRDFGVRNWKPGTTNLETIEIVKTEGPTGLQESKQKTGLSC